MLTAFRSFAQSWAAKVLMGLLILAMGAFGISRYGFQAMKGDEVIRAGSRVTNSGEFKREYDNYKRQLEQERIGCPRVLRSDHRQVRPQDVRADAGPERHDAEDAGHRHP